MDSERLGRAVHGGDHYENFPVASWLLPKALRPDVLALYRFARAGDDLADEPIAGGTMADRLKGLSELAEGLEGRGHGPLAALGQQLRARLDAKGIDRAPAHDLLSAFRQDAGFAPFPDWHSVLDYCSRSANPIGRLLLSFAGIRDARLYEQSDHICSGLQLINFGQDLHEDLARGRPTVPCSDWPSNWQWSDPRSFVAPLPSDEQARLTRLLIDRGMGMLASGQPLAAALRRAGPSPSLRLALEIAITRRGGCWVGQQLLANPLMPWHRSIRLTWWALPGLVAGALQDLRAAA